MTATAAAGSRRWSALPVAAVSSCSHRRVLDVPFGWPPPETWSCQRRGRRTPGSGSASSSSSETAKHGDGDDGGSERVSMRHVPDGCADCIPQGPIAASSDGAYICLASRGGHDGDQFRGWASHRGSARRGAGLSENMTARAAVPGAISLTRRPHWPSSS